MRQVQSYVIRIYRQDASRLAGMLEHVESGRRRAFRSAAELCAALGGRQPPSRRKSARTSPGASKPSRS